MCLNVTITDAATNFNSCNKVYAVQLIFKSSAPFYNSNTALCLSISPKHALSHAIEGPALKVMPKGVNLAEHMIVENL